MALIASYKYCSPSFDVKIIFGQENTFLNENNILIIKCGTTYNGISAFFIFSQTKRKKNFFLAKIYFFIEDSFSICGST